MRKELGLILAGAVCFDLGVVVIPSNAQQFYTVGKIKGTDHRFIACVENKGTVVEENGEKYCMPNKDTPPPGAPANQKK